MLKKRKNRVVLIGILIFFLFVITFFAFKLRMGLSPDSYYHLEVSQAYSTTWGIPENTPDTYKWRDITRIPFLYYWINARLLNINNGFINEVILLRLVNVIYSFATVFVTYLLSKEILKGKWKRLLPIFLLTNTLMFVFLSSSINYDNLANLFSILGIFYFVKFVKSKLNIKYLLLMLIMIGLGCFTKFTIVPLAFLLVLLSSIHVFKQRKEIKRVDIDRSMLLLIPLIIVFIFNVFIYGVNLIQYGALDHACEKILTHEQCLENGVYYRDNVTIPAIDINGISHISELVLNGERIDPIRYFGYWIWNITGKVYGIMGDSSLYMEENSKIPFLFFLGISILLSVVYRKKWNISDRYLIYIFIFYILILFFVQNYNMYLKHNHLYLALQGRYLFPVLPIGYILFTKSLSFIQIKWLKYLLLLILILLFTYSCIPFFALNVPTDWFNLNF